MWNIPNRHRNDPQINQSLVRLPQPCVRDSEVNRSQLVFNSDPTMQKLLKRTAQAQRQAGRRAKKVHRRDEFDTRRRNNQYLKMANDEIRQNLKDSRRARKEDWEMGPLAPKRDLGFNGYGTFRENLRQDWTNNGMNPIDPKVLEQRCAWAGGVKQLCLAPQDRVVILDGPDKGKVDRIQSVNKLNGSVTLENHHKALFQTWLDGKHHAQAMPISVGSIRLVYPITNPKTGITKDTIINEIKPIPANMESDNMSLDRWEYGNKWDRLVLGINVSIPWPEVQAPKFDTYDIDTTRDKVEARTFFYNLLSPPMPNVIIDELRNKYSKFRTRHDPEYIAMKELQERMKKGNPAVLKSMQTPLEEFHEKQRELKEARGEPELSEHMLTKLGEIIAKTKATSLEDAGITPLPTEPAEKTPEKTVDAP
ncbi:unnamed protein product [Clonostachys rosea f. rosea IK726]|uniref:Uncharacterized protein n=1 Tax=Clonostachys rosea f. rosea IK726 TaxID=1349383 RepID=A0ACA9UU47_BIOOC|nr:unnamed protein product [Clonostachys rosea f. rosea IK726]